MAGMKTIRESRGHDSDGGILRAKRGKNKEKIGKDARRGQRLESWWRIGQSNRIAERIHKLLCENCQGGCPTPPLWPGLPTNVLITSCARARDSQAQGNENPDKLGG